jgi:C4-dicarboxylate-binding protein DctP
MIRARSKAGALATGVGSLLLALALAVAGPAAAATKIIMSNDTNPPSLKGQTFTYLKEQVEKELGDKVEVNLHQSGTLFSQKTQVQGLQLGSAHFISPTVGIYSPLAPKLNALLLPFLLSTPQQIDKAMNDPLIKKEVLGQLENKNILPVAIWINGPRNIGYSGDKAVRVPDDMKGMKIRVQSADIFVESMKAFGANPISMSWGEVPTALQQGVIDAAEPTPNAWVGSKLYEMVSHITDNGYVYSFYIVATNKQWWDGLPEEIRAGLRKALDAATEWNWKNGQRVNDEANQKIKAAGVKIVEINDQERAKWVAASKPVWKKLGADLVGDAVMTRLQEIGEVGK